MGNICPYCGGRHDAPNANTIIGALVGWVTNPIMSGGQNIDEWKEWMLKLYDDKFDVKLINNIHNRLKEKEAIRV